MSPPPSGTPGWVWALVVVGGLLGMAILSLFAIAVLGRSAEPRFEPIGTQVGDTGFTTFAGDDYGDNPVLDRLWEGCERGDGQACDELYWVSAVGSGYERFGNTCGGRFSAYEVPWSCADALAPRPR